MEMTLYKLVSTRVSKENHAGSHRNLCSLADAFMPFGMFISEVTNSDVVASQVTTPAAGVFPGTIEGELLNDGWKVGRTET